MRDYDNQGWVKALGPMDLLFAILVSILLGVAAVAGGQWLSRVLFAKAEKVQSEVGPEAARSDIVHQCDSCVTCCLDCNVKDLCCCKHQDFKCTCPKPPKDPTHPSIWTGPETR